MIIFLVGLVAGVLGVSIFARATTAIHEMEGLCSFIIAAVLVGSAVVADEISKLRRDLKKRA